MDKPGFVEGKHYTTYAEKVRQLIREGNSDAAELLLLRLIDATEAEAHANRWGVAPWYYERLAVLYGKRKDLHAEIGILERYERQSKAPGIGPSRLAERLARVRAKLKKART